MEVKCFWSNINISIIGDSHENTLGRLLLTLLGYQTHSKRYKFIYINNLENASKSERSRL